MVKMKVGAITIGQSPRADVVQELLPLMGEQVELIQAGALDGLTREDIQAFAPGPEDYTLIETEVRLCLPNDIFCPSCSSVSIGWKSRA